MRPPVPHVETDGDLRAGAARPRYCGLGRAGWPLNATVSPRST